MVFPRSEPEWTVGLAGHYGGYEYLLIPHAVIRSNQMKFFSISGTWTTLEWLFLRCFGIDVTKKEMLQGRQDGPPPPLTDLDSKKPETIFALAIGLYQLQEERAKLLFEKSKILLTISAIVISVVAPFRDKWQPTWMVLFPITSVFVSIVLVLISFGLKAMMEPSIDVELLNSVSPEAIIARDYYVSAFYNQRTVSLLADIYRAARRAFGMCLLSLVVITVASLWLRSTTFQDTRQALPNKSTAKPTSHYCLPAGDSSKN